MINGYTGIHGFLLRLRNPDMSPCDGVTIEDMGAKMGCNGVDNGKLRFHNVRVPRSSLLDATSKLNDKVDSIILGIFN